MSSGLKSGFSSFEGASLAIIAFLKPAFSKDLFQSSTPFLMNGFHIVGVAGSK